MNEQQLQQKQDFEQKLRWKVYNKDFKYIKQYTYSCFTFKFKLSNQSDQEEFVEFITKENLMPWELGNFFITKDINFSINFRYVKGMDFKTNWLLLKTTLWLKKEHLRSMINSFRNNYKLTFKIKRKMINKKNRLDFMLKLINLKKKTMYVIQADSNIWWKPRKIIKDTDEDYSFQIGWLFMQVGKYVFKK